MAFNNWPWTSLQNLNLDWILRVCKEAQEAADTVDTFDTRITTAQQTADAADLTATTAASNADTARSEAATAQATANAAQASASAANTAISNIRQVPVSLETDVGKSLKATLGGSEWGEIREVPDTVGVSNGEVLTKTASGYEWTNAIGSGGTKIYYYNANNQTPFNYNIFDIIAEIGVGEILPIVTDSLSNNGSKLYYPVFWNTEWTVGDTDPKLIFASIREDRTAIDILSMAQPVHNGTPTVTVYTISFAYVTPEMFGAVGDGVADDTVAVSAAMQNKRVILSKNYKITNTINALAEVVFGNGSAKISSTGGTALSFANSVHLSDFSVETPVQTDGIAIRALKDIVAEHLNITGGRIGIQSDGSYFKNIFRGNTFKNFWGDSAAAVDVLYAGISEFSDNYVESVNNDLDRDADGVRFWQQSGVNLPSVQISNNEFYNCRGRFVKSYSNNTVVENNYCHNDDDFTVITNFVGIDIQRGNSVVRFNHVMSPHAITFYVRQNSDTTHLCEENIFENVDCLGAATTLRQIYVYDGTNGTGKTSVVIRHNKINNDIQMIQIPFMGASVYKITENEFTGHNYYAINTTGTFNANTRFEIHGNVDSEYAYDIGFSGGMPNVKGDRRVRCTDPVNFATISAQDVSFVANTTDLTDYANTAFLSKMGDGNNSFVLLSGDAMVGGYMRNAAGTRVFFHKYSDSVVPNVTSADNGKTLTVVNGEYSLV